MLNSGDVHADYVGDILDEIALEGLDGITTEALWKRLSVRPQFCFRIDEKSKAFIWDIVTRLVGIQFFELPEPRKPLENYDYLSQQCDQAKAVLELDELYPYSRLKNSSTYGSCKHFLTRLDVTKEVVNMLLEEVEYHYGLKLVIVASQESRNISLMGKMCPPSLDFSVMPTLFDMLEKIGRSRYLGVATNGKGSLQSVVEDPKSVHHYLKSLIEHKFVKKQSLAGSLQSNPHASKAYLVRYYGEHANEHQLILQTAIEELKSRPNNLMSHEDFYGLYDSEKKTRIKKYSKTALFRKYICLSKAVPYRTVYPNATQNEWERKSKVGERMIRYFKLIDANTEVSDIFEKDEEIDDEEEPSSFSQTNSTLYANQPLLVQAYNHIKNSGSRGLTQRELGDLMGLNKYYIRAIIKRLVGEKQCISHTEHDGRQQIKRFLVERSKRNLEAVKEIAQIISTSKEKPTSESEENKTTEVEVENETEKLKAIETGKTSYRSLKRIGLILKLVKTHRYRVFHQITKHIIEEEKNEGLSTTVDRRTIKKLLKKLVSDGLLKTAAVRDDDGAMDTTMHLYMDPTFVIDDQVGQALFHTATETEATEKDNPTVEELQHLEMEFSNVAVENLVEMKNMTKNIKAKATTAKGSNERELVYSPKFVRLNNMHELLFYLIYDYTGIVDKSQEEMILELSKTCAIDEDLKKEMPRLYGTQISNYMFVPPLKVNTPKTAGWCLMSDFLLRTPLSVFVKISKVGVNSPELMEYLYHPIRKHYLVKDLPFSVREALLCFKSQPFGSLHYDFRRLCYLGLLQFGVKFGTKHYQLLLFLNRNATLLDTTTITAEYYQLPADVEFTGKSYHFSTLKDVKQYWLEMFNFCMGTNLGVKECMLGKEISAEREQQKESLKRYLEPVDVNQAVENDNGHLPGDHLGAAGIDSVMFSFLKSNWMSTGKTVPEIPKVKPSNKTTLSKIRKEIPVVKKYYPRTKRRFKSAGLKKPTQNLDESKAEENKNPGRLRKVKRREVKCKPAKKVQYDDKDMEALKLMKTLRVTWSQAEDNFLLICKVAMMFQCPNQKTYMRIPYVELRNALHENVPESINKTQKAIGRRIVYMMKNSTTVKSVNLCLEELKQIPGITEKYGCQDLENKIKPSAPNFKELLKILYERFHALVLFMKDRFIDGTRIVSEQRPFSRDLIPDTLEEFLDMYELEKVEKTSLNVKRIREDTIRAILMSSLACKSEKTSSAVQLFEIYRQYEDDELQNAVRKLHGDGVITISKRANTSMYKSTTLLPLSNYPYQLSFAFQNLLNKKYSPAVYYESFEQINPVTELDEGEYFEINLNECNVVFYLLTSCDLLSMKPILPKEIVIFDKKMINDDKYSELVSKYVKNIQREDNSEEVQEEEVSGKRNLTDGETSTGKRRKIEINDQEVVELRKDGDAVEKDDVNSFTAALYLIREKLSKELLGESGKNVQDMFVVNASKVRCFKKTEEFNIYLRAMGPKIFNSVMEKIISRTSVPLTITEEDFVYQQFLEEGYDFTHLQVLQNVLQFIYSKKEFGATNEDLSNNFESQILPDIIKHLISTKIVSKSGIDETIYVAQKYSTPWLISSFKMTRLEREKIKPPDVAAVDIGDEGETPRKKRKGIISKEDLKREDYVPPSCSTDSNNKVKVIMRPWLRIDGTLNRKALEKFLQMVLGFLVMKPGISIKNVMKNFVPDITPVWTKDLIEILHEIGCIELRTHVVTRKSSLFSNACIEFSDSYTGLEDDDCVAIDTKINALTTLGLFMKGKIHV